MSKDDADKKSNINALRAKDIIPPNNEKNHQEEMPSTKEGNPPSSKDKVKQTVILSNKHENTVLQKTAIPKFDLAKQIMSEQRKVASVKRKAPDKKNKVTNHKQKSHSIGYAVKPPSMPLYQEQIITEIVRRDIQRQKKR